MRILVDLQSCQTGSRERGIGRYSMSLLKAMLERPRNHEFMVALNDVLHSSIEPIRGELQGLIADGQIRVWRQPQKSSPHVIEDAWNRAAAELMRESFLCRARPDVIHVSSVFEGVADEAVVTLKRFFDAPPIAVTHYDLIPYFYREKYLLTDQMRSEFDKRVDALRQADLFLAISEHTGRELVDVVGVDPARVVDIAAGVSSKFRKKNISEYEKARLLSMLGLSEDFVLYTGGGDSRKNIDGLITAYARLPEGVRATHTLAIVSRMPPSIFDHLQGLVRALKLEEQVRFIDYVTDEDLVRLYNLSGVVVLPSFHEGFGLPLLEAMACGAPALGSNRTSIPEVLGRAHAMFDPDDASDIAAKLLSVLSDSSFATRLREEGLAQAKKFTWQNSAEIALDSLEALHEQRGAKAPRSQNASSKGKRGVAIVADLDNASVAEWQGLLQGLGERFDVSLVGNQELGNQHLRGVNFVSVEAYRMNAMRYAQRIYHVTSASKCCWVTALAQEYPGFVFMEDATAGSCLSSGQYTEGQALLELYRSHGYFPLTQYLAGRSIAQLAEEYTCNRPLLAVAESVFVAKVEDLELIRQWYGSQIERKLRVLQLLQEGNYRDVAAHLEHSPDYPNQVAVARELAQLRAPVEPSNEDIAEVAECVAANFPDVSRQRQLFIDITELAKNDAKSGIQRVVRAVLTELLARKLVGYRVEPVFSDQDGNYCYARKYTLSKILGVASNLQGDVDDSLIEPRAGDIFLRLDLVLDGPDIGLQRLRNYGVRVYEVVYDLLPVKWPEHFIPEMPPAFHRWLDETSRYADGVVCISKAVADEMLCWLDGWQTARSRPLSVGYFHLGADIDRTVPTTGISDEVRAVLDKDSTRTFLMVGTIESRKGYDQVLDAFDQLWGEGSVERLVIVGRQGWLVDDLVQRILQHPENGHRLFWLSDVSDEALVKLYERTDALIMASEAEGFGLPLIEAAKHGIPLIARDLPVFREVAGEGALYFDGETGKALASVVNRWLKLRNDGSVPSSSAVEFLSWKQSLDQLLAVILDGKWYHEWRSRQRYFLSPVKSIVDTAVGKQRNHRIHTTGRGGLLVASQPWCLDAGEYEVRLHIEMQRSMPDRSAWYEFVADGQVLVRHWLAKDVKTDGDLIKNSIKLEHRYDDFQFRLWTSVAASMTFLSMEMVPVASSTERDDGAAAQASA